MKDLKHYLSLLAFLSIGFGLFWIFNFNRQVQILITVGLGLAYVAWGTVHHLIKKDFYYWFGFSLCCLGNSSSFD